MAKRLRRAGSPWRIKVHEWRGSKAPTKYGVAYHVTNDNAFGGGPVESEWSRHIELPGTEFDELVIGQWIHLEQQDDTVFWANIGGVTINISVDRDGQPKAVDVYGPADYAGAVDGVAYSLTWSDTPRPLTRAEVATELAAVLDRHEVMVRAKVAEEMPELCDSCAHLTAMHQDDGCWYTVTNGRPGRDLVCPCEVASRGSEEKEDPNPAHVGGNAEDCPACNLVPRESIPYPWICPGEPPDHDPATLREGRTPSTVTDIPLPDKDA